MKALTISLFMLCLVLVGCEPGTGMSQEEQNGFDQKIDQSKVEYQNILYSNNSVTEENLIVVLLDGSGSMEGNKIEVAKKSVKIFFENLEENQPIGFYVFDSNGTRWALVPNVYERSIFNKAVDNVNAAGGTPLGESMQEVKSTFLRLKQKGKYKNFILLIVTDGEAGDRSLMVQSAVDVIENGFYLDVIGYGLSSSHGLKIYSSRYREADETTLQNVMLEEMPK